MEEWKLQVAIAENRPHFGSVKRGSDTTTKLIKELGQTEVNDIKIVFWVSCLTWHYYHQHLLVQLLMLENSQHRQSTLNWCCPLNKRLEPKSPNPNLQKKKKYNSKKYKDPQYHF